MLAACRPWTNQTARRIAKTVEKPTAKLRVDENGAMVIDVDISPGADSEHLTTQRPDDPADGEMLGSIKGARPPRWVELAGG